MVKESVYGPRLIKGAVRGHRITEQQKTVTTRRDKSSAGHVELPGWWKPQGDFCHNDIMYDWATIVGELLRGAPDGKPYRLGAMFLEFENNGGAAVSPPTFEREDGISYYDDLLSSPTRDYLRVPLTVVTLTSTDEALFPRGNKITAFAQTDGVAGVHGKEFSAAQQSRVYGGALVSTPEFADATQDLVLARFYWSDTDEQMIKLVGSNIGLEWEEVLG